MSESTETKTRTVEQVQQEYTQVCARAGHIQYQMAQLKNDLEMANSTLQTLNREAFEVAQLAAKEAEKAKASAASSASEQSTVEVSANA